MEKQEIRKFTELVGSAAVQLQHSLYTKVSLTGKINCLVTVALLATSRFK